METATPAATLFGLPMSIVGLLIAIFVLIYLVLRTRVHAFIAMLSRLYRRHLRRAERDRHHCRHQQRLRRYPR